jgi:hypothetical protein
MALIRGGQVMSGGSRPLVSYAVGSPALAATNAVKAATASTGSPLVITTGLTQPDVPRNITATSAGTAGDIKAIQVVVAGTDINGQAITETLPAFTVDSATTVVGSKAFRTVTSVTIPAHDGTGATTAIGVGDKLGLPDYLSRNSVIAAYLAGVKEGTAPTVTTSTSSLSNNTADLNSAYNGTAVVIDYIA